MAMSSKKQTRLGAILGFVLLALVAWGVWECAAWLVVSLRLLDKDVAAAIIAACGTLVVGFATVGLTQRGNKQREIAEAHRKEKTRVYSQFMTLIGNVFIRIKKNEELVVRDPKEKFLDEDLLTQWLKLKSDLIVWASPQVLQSYLEYESISTDTDPRVVLLKVDTLLRAMRTDLGHRNTGLQPGHLMQMFLTPDARKELA